VTVTHELASLRTACCPTGTEHDVVKTELKHLEQVLTRDTAATVGLSKQVSELLFEHTVDTTSLLLLTKLKQVLTLADTTTALRARRIRTTLDWALHRVALHTLEVQLGLFAPAKTADRSGITSHN
jgi:hypothetical protein